MEIIVMSNRLTGDQAHAWFNEHWEALEWIRAEYENEQTEIDVIVLNPRHMSYTYYTGKQYLAEEE